MASQSNSSSEDGFASVGSDPDGVRGAVVSARRSCSGALRVLFRPDVPFFRSVPSGAMPSVFAGADEVVVCPGVDGAPAEGCDAADVYAACRDAGVTGVRMARTCGDALEHVCNSMRAGDFAVLAGFGGLRPRFAADQGRGAPSRAPVRRIWIGAGSNTWRSDLDLSVEYVKTQGPAGAPGATLGIPWMAGIPGTIGGWVKMNAGAFGHSFSEVIDAVKVDGAWISAEDCGFAYRRSGIRGEIQDIRLKGNFPEACGDVPAEAYLARRARFPPGTYGSFFKNPAGDFAGRLLEAVGAKGMRTGGAYVWSGHANVIVRGEGATASDVLALARLMRNRVFSRCGVLLEPEVSAGDAPLF